MVELILLWALILKPTTSGVAETPSIPVNLKSPPACGEVDLSSHFGAVRDQGNIGWCYAYSMADLLGEYVGVLPPDKISAFDVAVAYASPDFKAASALAKDPTPLPWRSSSSMEQYQLGFKGFQNYSEVSAEFGRFDGKSLQDRDGGRPAVAMLTYALKGGYCLESKLPSQSLVNSGTSPSWISGHQKPDPSGRWMYTKNSGDIEHDPNDPEDFVFRQIQTLERQAKADAPLFFPGCDHVQFGLLPQVDPTFMRAIKDLALGEIKKVIEAKCSNRISYAPPKVVNSGVDPAVIRKTLQGGSSMELAYDVRALLNPVEKIKTRDEAGQSHSSLIVGMRPGLEGSCQYKIRNSWGPTCEPYDSKIVKDCKDGSFWLDERNLIDVGFNTTRLSH